MKKKKRSFSKHQLISKPMLVAGLTSITAIIQADVLLGLVGGQQDDSSAYAAFLLNPNGTPSPAPDLPTDTNINSVSMNALGVGLIGGQTEGFTRYAAFVSTDGTLIPLTLPFTSSTINSVAIDSTGLGLIGGTSDSFVGYAAAMLDKGCNYGVTPKRRVLSVVASWFAYRATSSGEGLSGDVHSSNRVSILAH